MMDMRWKKGWLCWIHLSRHSRQAEWRQGRVLTGSHKDSWHTQHSSNDASIYRSKEKEGEGGGGRKKEGGISFLFLPKSFCSFSFFHFFERCGRRNLKRHRAHPGHYLADPNSSTDSWTSIVESHCPSASFCGWFLPSSPSDCQLERWNCHQVWNPKGKWKWSEWRSFFLTLMTTLWFWWQYLLHLGGWLQKLLHPSVPPEWKAHQVTGPMNKQQIESRSFRGVYEMTLLFLSFNFEIRGSHWKGGGGRRGKKKRKEEEGRRRNELGSSSFFSFFPSIFVHPTEWIRLWESAVCATSRCVTQWGLCLACIPPVLIVLTNGSNTVSFVFSMTSFIFFFFLFSFSSFKHASSQFHNYLNEQ